MTTLRGIIVLEGADCCGKTTLARYFVEKHGARYIHNRVWPDNWKYHVASIRLALKWADRSLVVVDRLWLSELIYGPIFRHYLSYDLGARSMERVLARAAAVTVLCSPLDSEKQIAVHAKRRDSGGERFTDIRKVVATYADLREGNVAFTSESEYVTQLVRFGDFTFRPDVLIYDVDRHGSNLGTFAKRVLATLDTWRMRQYRPALTSTRPGVVGHLSTATHLFVGDRLGDPDGATRWPWTAPDRLSAVAWINRSLHRLGWSELRGVWCNAFDDDDHLEALLRYGKPVICLGQKAHKRVREIGGNVGTVIPHPSFWKRFHHKEADEYTNMLREALRIDAGKSVRGPRYSDVHSGHRDQDMANQRGRRRGATIPAASVRLPDA